MKNSSMKKVFVLDDDKSTLNYIGNFLKDKGVESELFYNPKEFTERLKRGDKADIYFIDINLSSANIGEGFVLIESLRALIPSATIIAITKRNSSQDIDKIFSNGACEYIEKPIDPIFLSRILSRYLDENENFNKGLFPVSSSNQHCNILDDMTLIGLNETKLVVESEFLVLKNYQLVLEGRLLKEITSREQIRSYVEEVTQIPGSNKYKIILNIQLEHPSTRVHIRKWLNKQGQLD